MLYSRILTWLGFCISLLLAADADASLTTDTTIVYLEPAAFTKLPKPFQNALAARGCTIPQAYGRNKPHNVISGSFAARGQRDWAVLCSTHGVSSIQIFWGGRTRCASAISTTPDEAFLQSIAQGKVVYSREITTTTKHQAYPGRFSNVRTKQTSHDGIDDGFLGKASVVHYCVEGSWIELSGVD